MKSPRKCIPAPLLFVSGCGNGSCLQPKTKSKGAGMHLRRDFMSKRSYQSLMTACLLASTLWAANDPFVGRWKLNSSKSKLIDYMGVKSLGAKKYALDLGGGAIET